MKDWKNFLTVFAGVVIGLFIVTEKIETTVALIIGAIVGLIVSHVAGRATLKKWGLGALTALLTMVLLTVISMLAGAGTPWLTIMTIALICGSIVWWAAPDQRQGASALPQGQQDELLSSKPTEKLTLWEKVFGKGDDDEFVD